MSFESLRPNWTRRKPMKRSALKRKTPLRKVAKSKEKRARRFIPQSVRSSLLERSRGQCEVFDYGLPCMNKATDAHHIKPKGRGGKNELSNLIHICRFHHSFIHNNPKIAEENGWLK